MSTVSALMSEAEVEPDREAISRHVQDRMDLTHRELASARCLFVAGAYVVLAAFDFFALPEGLSNPTTLLALLVAGVFSGLAVFHRRSSYPATQSNGWMFLELVLLQANGLAFLVLTDNMMNGFGVYLLLIAAGFFMTRWGWLLAGFAFVSISWSLVLVQQQFDFGTVEALMLVAALLGGLFFFMSRQRAATSLGVHELRESNYRDALESALGHIETLRGLLPICASCKSIRDEAGSWQSIERYVGQRSPVEFTHSLCPPCIDRLYPDGTAPEVLPGD